MTEENPAELEKEVAHQADEMEHQADESRFGVATSILAPAPTVSECAESSTVDASLLRTYVPRCKSRQGWFRS